jgi:eukaryotic-like serine/threonine-protein kinase
MRLGDLNPTEFERMSALLDEALSRPTGQRQAWLAELATRDPQVAAQLGELLESASAAQAERLLETRDVIERRFAAAGTRESWVGKTIGPYRVISPLGQGGMGSVWLAERADGLFARRIALKLVHRSLEAAATERFARERQILAGLDHPHIARLLDAGFTEDGQPYLALEYVEGQPLTTYCDAHALDLRGRIELFLQVVGAVQFAHANLVVHRDLKPANILVTADGKARLLDFGIAKLIAEGHVDDSALTQVAGRAFTPDYASPEQILGAPVTTSSDIYALGVVLYELVCGTRPYQLKRDSRGALEDAILTADPIKPSQVPIPEVVARARSTSARKLHRELAGDLDTILFKALKKKPAKRYRTADAFGNDLQRHLRGEPVLARPDSRAYHLRKFVTRNKWAVGGATVTALALAAGTAVSLWQANVARDHAVAAQREATKAKVVQDFLLDIFRMNSVEQRDPEKARQTTARALLDLGAKRVHEGLKNAPEAQNEVLDTLANMYAQLGLPDEAAKHHRQRIEVARRAYGANDPRVAEALLSYAEATLDSPQRAQTLAVLDETRRVMDSAGDFTSETRGQLLTLYALANSYTSIGEMRRYADDAVAFFRKHYPDTLKVPLALQVAARARSSLGEFEAAETLYRETLAEVRRRDAGASAYAIVPLVGIALSRAALGDVAQAERHYREALAVSLERNGPNHGETLQSEVKLGAYLHATSRRVEGRRLLESAAAKVAPDAAPQPPGYVVAVVSGIRGASLLAEGALEEAERFIAVDVADARQHYPDSSPLASALRVQGSLYTALGRYDEADKLLIEAENIWRRIGHAADPATNNRYLLERARLAIARRNPAGAIELLGGVVPPQYAARLPLPFDAIAASLLTADAKLRQLRFAEAAQSAQAALQPVQASPLRDYFGSLEAEAALRLGVAQHHMRDLSNARTNLERALKLREALDDPASPWLAEAQLALGACLADLNQRSAAATLEARARTILASHPRLGAHFTHVSALTASPTR